MWVIHDVSDRWYRYSMQILIRHTSSHAMLCWCAQMRDVKQAGSFFSYPLYICWNKLELCLYTFWSICLLYLYLIGHFDGRTTLLIYARRKTETFDARMYHKGPPHHSLNDVKSIISTCNCVVIVRLRYSTVICLLQNTHNKHHTVILKKHVITEMSFVISRSDFRPLSLLCWVQTKHPLLEK